MRRDPLDPQVPQRPSDLRFRLLAGIFRFPAWRQGRLKHPRLVGVHCLRPTITLQITPQHAHILLGRVGFHESRKQRIGSVVDESHQVHLGWPSVLQPRMHAGVPLHQFARTFPPRSPCMHLPDSCPFGFPQPFADHPFTYRLLADGQAMLLRQILRDQRWTKIAALSPHQTHRSPPQPFRQPAVRPPASQPVDHHPVALALLALK